MEIFPFLIQNSTSALRSPNGLLSPVVSSPPVGLGTFLTLLPLTVNSVLQVGALVDSVAPGLCPDWEHWDPNEPVR